jgi:hypothetical protein
MKRNHSWASLLAVGLLSACGGSSYDATSEAAAPVADTTVPASATATPQAFSSYIGGLPAVEAAEPLDIENAQPPTSETDEPVEVG